MALGSATMQTFRASAASRNVRPVAGESTSGNRAQGSLGNRANVACRGTRREMR